MIEDGCPAHVCVKIHPGHQEESGGRLGVRETVGRAWTASWMGGFYFFSKNGGIITGQEGRWGKVVGLKGEEKV